MLCEIYNLKCFIKLSDVYKMALLFSLDKRLIYIAAFQCKEQDFFNVYDVYIFIYNIFYIKLPNGCFFTS